MTIEPDMRWATMGRRAMLAIALVSVLAAGGCKKKKPPLPVAQPPIIAEPQPQPEPPAVITPPVTTAPPATATAPPASKPKPKPRTPTRKPAPSVAKPSPAKPPLPEKPPSEDSITISANTNTDAAYVQRNETEQLLQSSEYNLRRINRTLNDGEQSMVHQVRNFITQSRLAMQDGDLERAYNLAVKANLLSGEIAK
ncbi:MAG TPA: hypothetical protein VEG32_14325 [Clostridia bacterium]|nr:hypothetical protein [Clostridia bacterium]